MNIHKKYSIGDVEMFLLVSMDVCSIFFSSI